jgi:hypothetical protein
MSDDEPPQSGKPPKSDARTAREARLAQALRDNLRRRKQGKTPSAPREEPD